MHFIKTLSTLTAVVATLSTAMPMPGVSNAEVNKQGFVEEVAAPAVVAAAAATTTQAAPAVTAAATTTQQQTSSQASQPEDKAVNLAATAGASSAGAAAVTSSAASPSYDTTVTVAASAQNAAAASATGGTIMTAEPKPTSASQPSSTAVASSVAAASATSAPAPSATTASSSSGSSSASSSSSGSSSGPGLTVINKCSSDVQAGEFQKLGQSAIGPVQTIAAGSSAHWDATGSAQVVKIFWPGTDIYSSSGNNANAEVEWTAGSGTFWYDLSLLTGNPFQSQGSRLDTPCVNQGTGTNSIICQPGHVDCPGAFYPGNGVMGTQSCPSTGSDMGLTYTLCSN